MTETETGMVLLDEATGRYFELNHSAATALKALLEGASPRHAARLLTDGHPGHTHQAAADVSRFVQELTGKGLAIAEPPQAQGRDRIRRGEDL